MRKRSLKLVEKQILSYLIHSISTNNRNCLDKICGSNENLHIICMEKYKLQTEKKSYDRNSSNFYGIRWLLTD